jgi:DNA-binding YbaB/EbfC family protein
MPMPPNINKMLEQAQKLQEEMAAAQDKLKEQRLEASAGGGMVKVVATGEGRLDSITIDPDAVDPEDVELLQDMVLAAVNEALRQADELREKAMGETAGFDPMEALGSLGLGGGLGGLGGPGGAPPNRAARRQKK